MLIPQAATGLNRALASGTRPVQELHQDTLNRRAALALYVYPALTSVIVRLAYDSQPGVDLARFRVVLGDCNHTRRNKL